MADIKTSLPSSHPVDILAFLGWWTLPRLTEYRLDLTTLLFVLFSFRRIGLMLCHLRVPHHMGLNKLKEKGYG